MLEIHRNSEAKKIVRNCIMCRKLHGKACDQLMADIPSIRVSVDCPPFTNTRVDYFGPFTIVHGRKCEIRYAVIFTCFTSLAMHLEISHSLSTDSFICALRRFICRRSSVSTIVSDNGTNLMGGEAYEREIKNVEKVFYALLNSQHLRLTDENLSSNV